MPCTQPPARFAAATYRRSSSGNRCQPIVASICRPPSPAGNRRAPSCASRVVTRKLSRRRSPASPGAPAAGLFHAAARELASSGIGRDAVPVPRIEEIFERGTFTRPMAEHAAIAGQRGGEVPRPHCCDAVGGAAPGHGSATCRRRHSSAGTSRSHLAQTAECRCDLAVSIGSDRPGAQNCRSRAIWTAQPTDRTWRQIRRVRAHSRIGIRCARPRSVTGRKLWAPGQAMDAAHASAVPSKAGWRRAASSPPPRFYLRGRTGATPS